jgi:hypothetical protein
MPLWRTQRITDRRRRRALAAHPSSEKPRSIDTETRGGGSCESVCSLFLFRKPLQTKLRIPAIVPQHPNPDIGASDVV